MAPSLDAKSWFTPVRLLVLFCCMSLLVYIDRGVISSNGVNGAKRLPGVPGYGIQGDFGLSLFEDGVLPAAFMVGLLGASLIFAQAAKAVNGFRLIGVGLTVWALAVAGGGCATGFWSLVFCRMFVGVGEASFVSLASPFIDDNAPPASKTRWLATFYLCIPVGYALGYIFGGLIAGPLGWRAAFWLEALAMAPFAIFCLVAPPVHALRGTSAGSDRKGASPASETAAEVKGQLGLLTGDLRVLAQHPVYTVTVAATAVYTGVIGAYAYMGPKAGRDVFVLPAETADLTFGAITVLTGVFGTVAGGVWLDRVGSSIPNALRLCAVAVAVGCVFCMLSFAAARSLAQFAPLFALGELGLFAIQAPANAVVLWSVPAGLRPLACSVQIVATHLLGDVPSPPLLGLLQGVLRNWRLSMSILSAALLVATALYLLAARLAMQQPDYRASPAEPSEDRTAAATEAAGGAVTGAGDSDTAALLSAEEGVEVGDDE